MKILFSEIFRVYKKAPIKITFIWLLDVLESLIIISDPYIIGNCIDCLLKKDFFWLVILIIINIVFWLSQTANNFFDTKIYSHIIEDESYCYYSKMIQTDADSSLISARLDLIDEIPNFLEIHFFEILNIIGGIAASLLFLYFNSTLFVFSFSIISVALIPAVTYRYQKGIVENNKQHKNLEEERMNQIAGRDKLAYKRYIQNLLKISISNSDLDTKIFFVANFLQMMLLFFSILSITNISNFTSGLLFSTVTYIEMLNGYVSDINGNLILLHDLKETTYRLKEETYDEL
ncbi:MAG: ABC transporter six-transmembrane domain-containing protein [Lachnospiraceae bacterium]